MATRSLGVWKLMDLTDTARLRKLQDKHKTFNAVLTVSLVTPYKALHLFKTVYFPQINFSLSSTTFGPKEIMKL